jgi:uncharacterized protein YuzE
MPKKNTVNFELSISGRDDGSIEAIYVAILRDEVSKTIKVVEDQLLVDYNKDDKIVGIEVLAPVKIAQLADLMDTDRRSSFRKFVVSTLPRSFVCD